MGGRKDLRGAVYVHYSCKCSEKSLAALEREGFLPGKAGGAAMRQPRGGAPAVRRRDVTGPCIYGPRSVHIRNEGKVCRHIPRMYKTRDPLTKSSSLIKVGYGLSDVS